MASPHNRKQNQLLASFSENDQIRLFPLMELVPMALGQVLCESDIQPQYVYFPTDCVVSIHGTEKGSASPEVAVVGHEGMLGVSALLDEQSIADMAIVQTAGHAYRIDSSVLKQEMQSGSSVQVLLTRYIQALLTQMAQTQGCNHQHSIDQQLCRWLLQQNDHLSSNNVSISQDVIANTLGVRHETVTRATEKLRVAGLIRSSQGYIQLVDRRGIEARACECYRVIRKEFDLLFPVRNSCHG